MHSRALIKALKADGWREITRTGTSHVQFRHPTKPGRVTVTHPKRDLPPGTLKGIERQAGIKLR
jgi:predicted RNA binding protein YcfA (HicA-like mRNA interferase family)